MNEVFENPRTQAQKAETNQPKAQVIDRAISNKTRERYQTAGEMLDALKKALP